MNIQVEKSNEQLLTNIDIRNQNLAKIKNNIKQLENNRRAIRDNARKLREDNEIINANINKNDITLFHQTLNLEEKDHEYANFMIERQFLNEDSREMDELVEHQDLLIEN